MIKRNIAANIVGQVWSAAMSLAFVPIYVRLLGMESYGIVGFYAVLQTWMSVLDLGLGQVMSREMARSLGQSEAPGRLRDLLRTVEVLVGAIGIVGAIVIASAASWICERWIRLEELAPASAATAIRLMGLIVGLRLLEGIYRSCIVGLQRQVAANALLISLSTLRGVGAIGVLVWWHNSIDAYFCWQALVSGLGLVVFGTMLYRWIPRGRRGTFSLAELRNLRGFAGGMAAIAILTTVLSQLDKAVLSRVLPLDEFGLYAMASAVSGGLGMIAAPIASATFPRLCQLHAHGDRQGFAAVFHRASQLVCVFVGAAAAMLAAHSTSVLRAWSGNSAIAESASNLVCILSVSQFMNVLLWLPYQAYVSHGFVRLSIVMNALLAVAIVPLLLWLTPRYGPQGSAWVLCLLNATYLTVAVPLVFATVHGLDARAWWLRDTLFPACVMFVVAIASRAIVPETASRVVLLILLPAFGAIVLAAGAAAAPQVRHSMLDLGRRLFRRVFRLA